MEFEGKIITFLQSGASQGWTIFFQIVSLLGSYVGMVFLYFVLRILNKKLSLSFLLAYVFGVGLNYILKSLISRDRPYITYSAIQPLTDSIGNSMPSGHAVSSTIIAVFACFLILMASKSKFTKIASIITGFMFVFVVCLSRMYLGVHYLTDLILGALVGLLISFISIMVLLKSSNTKVKEE